VNRRLNRARMAVFAVGLVLALLGCEEEEAAVSDWQVLFSDGFNRANTTGQNLGSADWIVATDGTVPGGTTMLISSNQVEAHWADGALGVFAVYQGTVDYSERIKLSVMFKVNSSGAVPNNVCGLGACRT
jgi:hypothetical protein